MRSLCDFSPPYGIRDLSNAAGVPAPTLSRVIGLLDREGLVERGVRQSVAQLDVSGVIRRWAQDYSFLQTNVTATYLEPRGASVLREKLRSIGMPYAATGSVVASMIAPIAPPRLLQVYVRDIPAAARALGLREIDAGANTILARPFSPVVFERTSTRDTITIAALAQVAVDLMTSPGRAPSEGEELLTWMERNEDAWRMRP